MDTELPYTAQYLMELLTITRVWWLLLSTDYLLSAYCFFFYPSWKSRWKRTQRHRHHRLSLWVPFPCWTYLAPHPRGTAWLLPSCCQSSPLQYFQPLQMGDEPATEDNTGHFLKCIKGCFCSSLFLPLCRCRHCLHKGPHRTVRRLSSLLNAFHISHPYNQILNICHQGDSKGNC